VDGRVPADEALIVFDFSQALFHRADNPSAQWRSETPMTKYHVADSLAALPGRISDVVTSWAEHSPDHPALVEASGTWTYRQLASVISETQNWLLELGVRPGDRVMIVCEKIAASSWRFCLPLARPRRMASAGECTHFGARDGRDSRSLRRSSRDLYTTSGLAERS
jgi:hypothetical protein